MRNKVLIPLGTKIIFNNEYLEIMSLLCSLYCFRRKKLYIEEIIFYYSILKSDIDIVIENKEIIVDKSNAKIDIDVEFVKMHEMIYKSLVILVNFKYVDIIDIGQNIQFKISQDGIDVVKSLESEYYKDLITIGEYLNKELKYNRKNINVIIGGGI